MIYLSLLRFILDLPKLNNILSCWKYFDISVDIRPIVVKSDQLILRNIYVGFNDSANNWRKKCYCVFISPFQYHIFNILRYEFVYRKSTFLCKIKNGVFVRLDRFGCINYECKRRVKYLWSLWRLCTLLTFTRNTSIKARKYEIGSNHRNL